MAEEVLVIKVPAIKHQQEGNVDGKNRIILPAAMRSAIACRNNAIISQTPYAVRRIGDDKSFGVYYGESLFLAIRDICLLEQDNPNEGFADDGVLYLKEASTASINRIIHLLRRKLGEYCYISAYPLFDWVNVEQHYMGNPDIDSGLGRHLAKNSLAVFYDSQGRFVLPDEFKGWASIDDRVRCVGSVTHIEIWNPAIEEKIPVNDSFYSV